MAALWAQELPKIGRWHAFLETLERQLPGFVVGDGTAPTTVPCFRCIAYPPEDGTAPLARWIAVGCVSILAPVYVVYAVRKKRERGGMRSAEVRFEHCPESLLTPAQVIGSAIEAEFGARLLPLESAHRPVPLFVEWKAPPETTLFHALFTASPEIIP
ncbi:hypothetical protein OV207_15085 [Corallococcus sp. BB11-1]|uniref:hypothetical protein n=1 Tax=Corallococcus sp. BB11-1 TaxID=2996783 RepID=UPI0022713B37|nr:hypothetical protein [Corallococcus sp. BB11-1]MCY1032793.1 hypothetical protein [Corallococcus sp. BB11-1]